MAANDSSKLIEQPTVVELGARLQIIAAQIAGFRPILDGLVDDVDKEAGDSIALLAGMADYLNREISVIAEQATSIGKQQTA